MQTKKVTQTLRCKMTPEETALRAHELSKALVEKASREAEMETVKTKIKSEIKSLETMIHILADKVNTGHEDRLVEVRVDYDFIKGVKTFFRLDTGEAFKTDGITPQERQTELPPA